MFSAQVITQSVMPHQSLAHTELLSTDASDCTSLLDSRRPAHAYPSSYPPLCSYNPFPIQKDVRHFATPWMRRSISLCDHHDTSVNVVHLAALFAKMKITGGERKNRAFKPNASRMSHSGFHGRLSTTLGFTTVVPRAPLPALLTTSDQTVSLEKSFIPVPRVPQPSHRTAETSLLTPLFAVLSNQINEDNFERKVLALPERMAASPNATCPYVSDVFPPSDPNPRPLSAASSTSSTSYLGDLSRLTSTRVSHQSSTILHSNLLSYVSGEITSTSSSSAALSNREHSHVPISDYYQLSQGPVSRRKIAALPRRTPNTSIVSLQSTTSRAAEHSSPLRTLSSLSRMSSISSISSASSSGYSSSDESDGPVTPSLLLADLPSPHMEQLTQTSGKQLTLDLADVSSVNKTSDI